MDPTSHELKSSTRPGDAPGDDLAPLNFGAAAAIAGDRKALENLWRDHRRWVAAILLAHKPRWADLEDLLQEVAVALVRKVGEIREPGAIKPWLRTVAINAAHAAARPGSHRAQSAGMAREDTTRPGFDEGTTADELPAPLRLGAMQEAGGLLDLASRLPDGYREPLLLKAVQGLSYREIGRILNLPETTIETRIARARRQVREWVAQRENAGASDGGAPE